jgi:hypothetical protein
MTSSSMLHPGMVLNVAGGGQGPDEPDGNDGSSVGSI